VDHYIYPKPQLRLAAKFIDFLVIFLIALILPGWLSMICGVAYILCADGMSFGSFQSQSIGKKIFNFKVVSTVTNKNATLKDSAFRNAPLGILVFLGMIPIIGWFFFIILGIPLLFIEIYLILKIENQQRLGDVMADTLVISQKNTTQSN